MEWLKRIVSFTEPEPTTATVEDFSGDNPFDHAVVGGKHYQEQRRDAVNHADRGPSGRRRPEVRVVLVTEPKNRYDRNAVKVMDLEGRLFGYLPREHAADLAPTIRTVEQRGRLASCMARLVDLEKDGKEFWAVYLDYDFGDD